MYLSKDSESSFLDFLGGQRQCALCPGSLVLLIQVWNSVSVWKQTVIWSMFVPDPSQAFSGVGFDWRSSEGLEELEEAVPQAVEW